jgi:multidrug efflux pump subunit AcrA (membrane-fusion protein)
MYVDVQLITDTRPDALLVPKRALVYDNDQIFVYRLSGEGRVERVLVRPLLENKSHIQPAGELTVGDQVVVAGQAGLKDGALVRLPGETA